MLEINWAKWWQLLKWKYFCACNNLAALTAVWAWPKGEPKSATRKALKCCGFGLEMGEGSWWTHESHAQLGGAFYSVFKKNIFKDFSVLYLDTIYLIPKIVSQSFKKYSLFTVESSELKELFFSKSVFSVDRVNAVKYIQLTHELG